MVEIKDNEDFCDMLEDIFEEIGFGSKWYVEQIWLDVKLQIHY